MGEGQDPPWNDIEDGETPNVELMLVRHLPSLRAFIRLRCDPKLRAAEANSDLVQSICRIVLEKADKFRFGGDEGFRKWLFTTAMRTLMNKNVELMALKRGGGRNPQEIEELSNIYRELSSPSQHAMAHEQIERLERAFDQLTPEQREVITLSRLAGLSMEELSNELGKSPGATRVALHRALARLAAILDAD